MRQPHFLGFFFLTFELCDLGGSICLINTRLRWGSGLRIMAGPCVSELWDKITRCILLALSLSSCTKRTYQLVWGHTVRRSWFRGSKQIKRIRVWLGFRQEELGHEPTQGDDLSRCWCKFIGKNNSYSVWKSNRSFQASFAVLFKLT